MLHVYGIKEEKITENGTEIRVSIVPTPYGNTKAVLRREVANSAAQ